MSVWTHMTGTIQVVEGTSEEQMLNLYHLFSHHFVGSEGGPHISFTKRTSDYVSASHREYSIESFQRLSSMVFDGKLRDFDQHKLLNAIASLRHFLQSLDEEHMIHMASFSFLLLPSDTFHHLAFFNGSFSYHTDAT